MVDVLRRRRVIIGRVRGRGEVTYTDARDSITVVITRADTIAITMGWKQWLTTGLDLLRGRNATS